MLWHGHARLSVELGLWCLLMMRLPIEVDEFRHVLGCTVCSDSAKCCKIERTAFTVQMNNDPEHNVKVTQKLLKAEILNIL